MAFGGSMEYSDGGYSAAEGQRRADALRGQLERARGEEEDALRRDLNQGEVTEVLQLHLPPPNQSTGASAMAGGSKGASAGKEASIPSLSSSSSKPSAKQQLQEKAGSGDSPQGGASKHTEHTEHTEAGTRRLLVSVGKARQGVRRLRRRLRSKLKLSQELASDAGTGEKGIEVQVGGGEETTGVASEATPAIGAAGVSAKAVPAQGGGGVQVDVQLGGNMQRE